MKKGEDYPGVAVVFVCHDGKGKILFNKRSKNCRDEHDTWDVGAGGVEFGEKIIDTLKKEIAEEYCTDVLDYEFLGYRDVHSTHQGKPTHWVTFDFKVLVDREKAKNGEPHKFDEIGWFTKSNLPTPMHSQVPNFFKIYNNKL